MLLATSSETWKLANANCCSRWCFSVGYNC